MRAVHKAAVSGAAITDCYRVGHPDYAEGNQRARDDQYARYRATESG